MASGDIFRRQEELFIVVHEGSDTDEQDIIGLCDVSDDFHFDYLTIAKR